MTRRRAGTPRRSDRLRYRGGWHAVPRLLWRARVSWKAKLGFCALLNHADGDLRAFPSLRRLAAETGASRSALGDGLRECLDAGMIERITIPASQSYLYELQPPERWRCPLASDDELTPRRGRPEKTVRLADTEQKPSADDAKTVRGSADNRPPGGQNEKGEVKAIETVRARARETWLTPYLELHEAIMGGTIEGGKLARHLMALHTRHGPTIVIPAYRCYLEHLVAEGRQEFLSLPRFVETFGRWRNGDVARRRDRPTQRTDKDYRT